MLLQKQRERDRERLSQVHCRKHMPTGQIVVCQALEDMDSKGQKQAACSSSQPANLAAHGCQVRLGDLLRSLGPAFESGLQPSERSSGVGSREARLPPINGRQVRDKWLTAYYTLNFPVTPSRSCKIKLSKISAPATHAGAWISFIACCRESSCHS